MIEKIGGSKPSLKKKREPKWGEEGFMSNVYYGCYVYKIIFTPQDNIENIVDISGKVLGAINYNEQIIVIASNASEQLKKLTVWHELVHMMLLNNNVNDGRTETRIDDEGFTDTLASRIYETTIRNPEMMRWLQK